MTASVVQPFSACSSRRARDGGAREGGGRRTDEHLPPDLVPHALPLRALDPLPLLDGALERLLERVPVPALGVALDLRAEALDPGAVRGDVGRERGGEGRELEREGGRGGLERGEVQGRERVERGVERADPVADARDLRAGVEEESAQPRRRRRRRRSRAHLVEVGVVGEVAELDRRRLDAASRDGVLLDGRVERDVALLGARALRDEEEGEGELVVRTLDASAGERRTGRFSRPLMLRCERSR